MTKSGGQSLAPNSGGLVSPVPPPPVIYAHVHGIRLLLSRADIRLFHFHNVDLRVQNFAVPAQLGQTAPFLHSLFLN